MASEEIKKMGLDASMLKSVILRNSNIDILLYLAKYNPETTVKEIADKFGKDSIEEVEILKQFCLIKQEDQHLTLTEEGIFQVEGLLTLVV